MPTRYYLRREDVRMDLFRPTTFTTACPFKGEASYWSAAIGGQTHDGIVWAYESPLPSVANIEGHLSFYPDRATVTVEAQPEVVAGVPREARSAIPARVEKTLFVPLATAGLGLAF